MAKQRKIAFIIVSALIVFLFAVSLLVGKYPITFGDIKNIIWGGDVSELKAQVFWNLRFSRTLMVLLAGAGLSLAGSVFQTVFQNPLASPDIIGVTSGANLGAAVSIVLFGSLSFGLVASSFLGGMAVVLLLVVLSKITNSKNANSYILIGIIIKSLAEAGVMTMKYFADPEKELGAIEFWAMGSFANITIDKLLGILPFYIVGFAGIVLLQRQVYMLSISDDESRSLGVNVEVMRIVILSFATLLVSSVVSVSGLVKFVGLISPHIARLVLKKEGFQTAVFSALVGCVILLLSDCIVRSVSVSVLPISIITTLIAAPFLGFYLLKQKGDK